MSLLIRGVIPLNSFPIGCRTSVVLYRYCVQRVFLWTRDGQARRRRRHLRYPGQLDKVHKTSYQMPKNMSCVTLLIFCFLFLANQVALLIKSNQFLSWRTCTVVLIKMIVLLAGLLSLASLVFVEVRRFWFFILLQPCFNQKIIRKCRISVYVW